MNKEVHPNMQAVQVTMDILESIKNNLRGKAGKHPMKGKIMSKIHNDIGEGGIVEFVAELSTKIDNIVDGYETPVGAEYRTLEEQIMSLWKSRLMDVSIIQFRTNKKGQGIWKITADLKRKEAHP